MERYKRKYKEYDDIHTFLKNVHSIIPSAIYKYLEKNFIKNYIYTLESVYQNKKDNTYYRIVIRNHTNKNLEEIIFKKINGKYNSPQIKKIDYSELDSNFKKIY